VLTCLLGGLELGRVRGLAHLDAAAGVELWVGEVGHPVRADAGGVVERRLEVLRLLLRALPAAVREQLLARLLCVLELGARVRVDSVLAAEAEAVAAANDGLGVGEGRYAVLRMQAENATKLPRLLLGEPLELELVVVGGVEPICATLLRAEPPRAEANRLSPIAVASAGAIRAIRFLIRGRFLRWACALTVLTRRRESPEAGVDTLSQRP
jgi:hypothetical protein